MSIPYQAWQKRCIRGHPIDGPHCMLCDQEDRDQASKDEALLEALRRLHAAGKLRPLLEEALTTHD